MQFLPEDYEVPGAGGNYLKLEKGENKIRILSRPVMGWEDWTLDKKPVRFLMNQKPLKAIDEKKPIKHFWAFVVWNYAQEKIQIMQISQKTIQTKLQALSSDEEWGAPFFYDLKIFKEGEMQKTEYNVNPVPHKPLDPKIKEAFMAKPCNLEALFSNGDPFGTHWKAYTEGVFDKEVSAAIVVEKRTKEEIEALKSVLADCDQKYTDLLYDELKKIDAKFTDFSNLGKDLYDKVLTAAKKQKEKLLKTERRVEAFA